MTSAGESAEPAQLRPLDRGAITLWRIKGLASGAIFIAAAIATGMLLDLPIILAVPAMVIAAAVMASAVAVPPMRYRAWRFAIRREHVFLQHGVLFRTTSIVPHARIQHVDTRHGPVDRWLGLAELVIYTAGTRGAIVVIPALAADEAEELRDHLAALSGAGDAV